MRVVIYSLLAGFLVLFGHANGQTNLIRNHSFENGTNGYPTTTGQLDKRCRRWRAFKDSPGQDGTSDWLENVPGGTIRGGVNCETAGPSTMNQAPHPPVHDGQHFAGIIRERANEMGEGIQQRFRRGLASGMYKLDLDYLIPCDTKSYVLRFYLGRNRNDLNYLASTKYLSPDSVGHWQNLRVRLFVPPSAHRDYKWLTILNDGSPNPNASGQTGAYIYLDDIHMFEADCDSCTPRGPISYNTNIANYFSPNGDGIADVFSIENVNNATYFEFEVYVSYGNVVYRSNGSNANGFENLMINWDGRHRNGNFLSPNTTVDVLVTLSNCDSEVKFLHQLAYCRNSGFVCDTLPHAIVPNYVPLPFASQTPATHYRCAHVYGGPYNSNRNWYACDSIFVGSAGSRRTPYFIAGPGANLGFIAGQYIEIVQGDSVDIDTSVTNVEMRVEPVQCCDALRMGPEPAAVGEELSKGMDSLSGHESYVPKRNIHIPNESTSEVHCSVYPNPACGRIIVEVGGGDPEAKNSFEMRDLLGRPVLQFPKLQEGRNELDISDLPEGNYFYRVKSEDRPLLDGKILVLR